MVTGAGAAGTLFSTWRWRRPPGPAIIRGGNRPDYRTRLACEWRSAMILSPTSSLPLRLLIALAAAAAVLLLAAAAAAS